MFLWSFGPIVKAPTSEAPRAAAAAAFGSGSPGWERATDDLAEGAQGDPPLMPIYICTYVYV